MKNFDEVRKERQERERTFQIGGEPFTYRADVTPEELLPWYRMRSLDVVGLSQEEQLGQYDETVLVFLEAGQEKRWKQVRATRGANALTLPDIVDLIEWLLEEQAARPTTQPSGSSSGSGRRGTGTTSKAESSSPAAKA